MWILCINCVVSVEPARAPIEFGIFLISTESGPQRGQMILIKN